MYLMNTALTTLTALLVYVGAYKAPLVATVVNAHRNEVARFNCKGVCKKCGAKTSVIGEVMSVYADRWTHAVITDDGRAFAVDNGAAIVPCRGTCGSARYAFRVIGKYNAGKECNSKCMAACGPSCECRCKGMNHGAGFSL